MKIALIGINARYTHTNLAIKYLKEVAGEEYPIDLFDFTINDRLDHILRRIIQGAYSHVGFSVYIWNVNEIRFLIENIKKIRPETIIFAGGPEVSFESKEFMEENPLDYLMVGEGEEVFLDLLKHFVNGQEIKNPSILYKANGKLVGEGRFAILEDINKIPPIYLDDKYIEENRYLYFETSRGCPFNCSFCLSSSHKGVRFRETSFVIKELKHILEKKVELVKFIDRSFNFSPNYKEIIRFLIDNDNSTTTFHLEIHPSLIDQEFISLIESSRKDLFQFEIGLQTTNEKTAREISRVGSFEEIKEMSEKLIKTGAHIHMDLIAGLPHEDYKSFSKSFDDLYSIGPDKIQLGFLKMLKGSRIRREKGKFSYKFFSTAPYQVIENDILSYRDLMRLEVIEDCVEKYYNEGYFKRTISYIIYNYYERPWTFFEELASFWEENGLFYKNISRIDLYNQLYYFLKENSLNDDYIRSLIIFDYYSNSNVYSTAFALVDNNLQLDKLEIRRLLEINEEKLKNHGFEAKTILKKSSIQRFKSDPLEDKREENTPATYIFIRKGKECKYFRLEEIDEGLHISK